MCWAVLMVQGQGQGQGKGQEYCGLLLPLPLIAQGTSTVFSTRSMSSPTVMFSASAS